MKLRNHPKLRGKWPPKLQTLPSSFGRVAKFMTKDEATGVLATVKMEPGQGTTPPKLVLTTIEHEHQGEELQRSTIAFSEDAEFDDNLHQTLIDGIGQTIKQIGDQEIDY